MRWIITCLILLGILTAAVPYLKRLQGFQQQVAGQMSAPEASGSGVTLNNVDPSSANGGGGTTTRDETSPAEVQVYRWRDASGTLHIESRPPPAGTQAEVLTFRGQKRPPVAEPASSDERQSRPSDPVRQPLSVYTPDGLDQLLDRLDQTIEQMDERRSMMEELQKDL